VKRKVAFLLIAVMGWMCASGAPAQGEDRTLGGAEDDFLWMGGCGGVYFLAFPGELVVKVGKRDRNHRDRHTELRALLVGPDRRVLQEETIPDDGLSISSGMGPVQTATLRAHVEFPGIYALNVTVSQDRYGEDMVWGLQTSCERFVIETARGHKDERHMEPIVLESPERSGQICFLPWEKEMMIEGSGFQPGAGEIRLLDSAGKEIVAFPVREDGSFCQEIGSSVRRDSVPWSLALTSMKGILHVDGLTRWERAHPMENMCMWSPSQDAFFPFLSFRWLLTPYFRSVFLEPGEEITLPFQVHHRDLEARSILFKFEGNEGKSLHVELEPTRMRLDPIETREVSLRIRAPLDAKVAWTGPIRLRANFQGREELSTFSTIELRRGKAPVREPLELPFQLKPYEHENEQLGYLPQYPLDNQFYFDCENRPCQVGTAGIHCPGDGQWEVLPIDPSDQGWSLVGSKVAFDREGRIYVLGARKGEMGILWSQDQGEPLRAMFLPRTGSGSQSGDLEQFSGHNDPEGPPAVLRCVLRQRDPERIWRRIQDLDLFLPSFESDELRPGDAIRLSEKCIGFSGHSGIPSSMVSKDGHVHVVWAEATDPKDKVPGVPTLVATVDRNTGKRGEPVIVGYGPPPNDIHNTPSITMDSQGFLHVLVGTHGRPFQYTRSLAPNTAHEGWTEPKVLGQDLRQTYVGFVCDHQDTLHVVFRLWKQESEPFPKSHFATLASMRKETGRDWEGPEILLLPAFSEYSVFYHRLTVDRLGRLFLSYDYWSTHWFYRNDHYGARRAMMMSEDGGRRWRLVHGEDVLGLSSIKRR